MEQARAHHLVPAKVYAAVLAALLLFTATTVAAAGMNFGSPAVNVVVALGIATLKASLVVLYFMHLRYDKPLNGVIFVAGLLCLAIFIGACFGDTDSRDVIQPSTGRMAPVIAPAVSSGK